MKPAEWTKILDKYDPSSQHRSEIDSLLRHDKPDGTPAEKPAETKPEDAPKPAEAAKPAETTKPEDQPKPAELAKTDNSPKSALKPDQPAKITEALKPEPAKLEEKPENQRVS